MPEEPAQPDPDLRQRQQNAPGNGGNGSIQTGTNALIRLAEIAIPGLLPAHRGPVVIFFAVAIVVLVVLVSANVGFIFGGSDTTTDGSAGKSSNWTFWVLLAFMSLAAVVNRGFTSAGDRKSKSDIEKSEEDFNNFKLDLNQKKWWSRRVPRLPLPNDNKVQDLIERLITIRTQAHSWLSEHNDSDDPPALQDIRVNVFLPRYKDAEDGVLCRLFMDDRFRIGMDGHPDEGVTFLPGEGATGLVFQKQGRRTARFLENAEGKREWEDPFVLTEQQLAEIHPDLRWVISLPLRHPDTPEVMGVMNVDCLNHMYGLEVLDGLMGELLENCALFSAKLADLPVASISVLVEE